MERDQAQGLVELQREALERRMACTALDALDAADAEDELLEALERLGIEEAWKLSEPLASAGVDAAWLARVQELAGPATRAALQWIAASLTAQALAAELTESTDRMSALVAAVKSYAYMDRGELVEIDLHEGLETTLTVLGHKLKHTDIEIVRDYDRSLPRMHVYGGELNQVWTNLIDNAIQALGEARHDHDRARRWTAPARASTSIDDGPGIPAEVARAHLRPVLHDQGGRPGHGPRARHRAAHRRRAPPRQHGRREPARRDRVPRLASTGKGASIVFTVSEEGQSR